MGKTFIWWKEDRCYGEDLVTYGPHYQGDVQLIGKNISHTLEELLKIGLSDSIKARLTSAKKGTCIKVMKYGTRGDLMLKCISEDELDYVKQLKEADDKLILLQEEIRQLEKERKKLNTKLIK
jgi:hypothetical protein